MASFLKLNIRVVPFLSFLIFLLIKERSALHAVATSANDFYTRIHFTYNDVNELNGTFSFNIPQHAALSGSYNVSSIHLANVFSNYYAHYFIFDVYNGVYGKTLIQSNGNLATT